MSSQDRSVIFDDDFVSTRLTGAGPNRSELSEPVASCRPQLEGNDTFAEIVCSSFPLTGCAAIFATRCNLQVSPIQNTSTLPACFLAICKSSLATLQTRCRHQKVQSCLALHNKYQVQDSQTTEQAAGRPITGLALPCSRPCSSSRRCPARRLQLRSAAGRSRGPPGAAPAEAACRCSPPSSGAPTRPSSVARR